MNITPQELEQAQFLSTTADDELTEIARRIPDAHSWLMMLKYFGCGHVKGISAAELQFACPVCFRANSARLLMHSPNFPTWCCDHSCQTNQRTFIDLIHLFISLDGTKVSRKQTIKLVEKYLNSVNRPKPEPRQAPALPGLYELKHAGPETI